MKPRRNKQGGGVMKSGGDFLPLDSTGEIDIGKLPPALPPAHSSFLKCHWKNWRWYRKKTAKLFQATENSGEQGIKNIRVLILANKKNPDGR